ncbi:MAG TPA: class I SAM-dependent methyltransferase [Chthoniobacterales bacterium]|jgi:ubiquinone/menaquinone biosynthesis C-methylase UbiE|nr:class I SAM-dependent methyltransferase [Chthoniobacterales bacterium]
MGFYNNVILPRLCHLVMRNRSLVPYRERVIASAEGRVLEIGIGSGLNLPFYGPHVREIVGLEPAPRLIAMARQVAERIPMPVTFMEESAAAIPLDDNAVDTVVMTWTLCTIPQADRALSEMRRVLKPNGRLLFVEHGLAPDDGVRRWQDWLTSAWKRISGGCHLNRPIQSMIESAGFRLDRLHTAYMPGPKPMSFIYEGSARSG